MRYTAKLLGLVAVTAVMVPFAEIPGFLRETPEQDQSSQQGIVFCNTRICRV